MSKKSKVLGVIIIIIIIFTLIGSVTSRAETIEIPQIPEPGQTWEDYNSQHPIPDVWPTPTAEPTVEPGRPPLLGGTIPYNRCRIRGWRLFSSGSIPPSLAWQKLTYPYSEVSTQPGFYAINRTTNDAGTEYVYADDGNNQITLTPGNSILNLVDTYIYVNPVIYYSNFSNGATVGYGLDEGQEAAFLLKWDVSCWVKDTSYIINDFPISVEIQVRYDDGSEQWMRQIDGSLIDLKNGIFFNVRSDRPGRKIYFVSTHLYIGVSDLVWSNLPWMNGSDTRAGTGDVPLFVLQSNNNLTISTTTYQMEATNTNIWDAILNLPAAIGRIFVPSQADFQSWIQGKVDSQPGDSSTMLYYQAFLQILNTVGDYHQEEVHFKIPPLRIRVNGINYQYFDGIDYNFSDADIQLEGQNHTLFWYSRLVGDVLIVSGFCFGFLYKMWKRVFDVSYAAGMEAYDVEDLQW